MNDWEVLEQAADMSVRAHADQKRHDGGPYIIHPMRMAFKLLKEYGPSFGVQLATIALLHDVVEDTDVTLTNLEDVFPEWVAPAVAALTRIEDPDRDFKEVYMDFVRRSAAHPLARKVKLADVRDNMRNVDTCKPGLRTRYERALKILELADKEEKPPGDDSR